MTQSVSRLLRSKWGPQQLTILRKATNTAAKEKAIANRSVSLAISERNPPNTVVGTGSASSKRDFMASATVGSKPSSDDPTTSLEYEYEDLLDTETPVLATTTTSGGDILSIEGNIPVGGNGIAVGQFAELKRNFKKEDIKLFGQLTGDMNPIHFQGNSGGCEGEKGKVIVHGMLVSSLFSTIFGTLIPSSVYRSQTLRFRTPIMADDTVLARVDVTDITVYDKGCVVKCDTSILRPSAYMLSLSGKAEVWLEGVEPLGDFFFDDLDDLDMR